VVVAITPWNAPVQTNLQKIVPALAAGCTVVLKAAHETHWSATMLGRAASQCPDLPPGAFNVLTSSGEAALGAMLTGDPRVDVVSFTGSTATGRRVMKSASRTIKKTLLEMGGKSAMIVLDDAEFPQALMSAGFVCYHAGQGCVLTTRLLVPRSRYDGALAILEPIYRNMPYGDPTDKNNIMGPLAKGYYVEPTLFGDVDNKMTIAQEEIFGPVRGVSGDEDDRCAGRLSGTTGTSRGAVVNEMGACDEIVGRGDDSSATRLRQVIATPAAAASLRQDCSGLPAYSAPARPSGNSPP
jgi:aldehyde dehydrogenase (NAD+)